MESIKRFASVACTSICACFEDPCRSSAMCRSSIGPRPARTFSCRTSEWKIHALGCRAILTGRMTWIADGCSYCRVPITPWSRMVLVTILLAVLRTSLRGPVTRSCYLPAVLPVTDLTIPWWLRYPYLWPDEPRACSSLSTDDRQTRIAPPIRRSTRRIPNLPYSPVA